MGLLSRKLAISMILFEIMAIVLYALFVRFDEAALPTSQAASISGITYSSKYISYLYLWSQI